MTKRFSVSLRTEWLWFRVPFSHLNFRYCACFEKGVSWHSGNYRVRIHFETCTWHDKDIQSWQVQRLLVVNYCYKTLYIRYLWEFQLSLCLAQHAVKKNSDFKKHFLIALPCLHVFSGCDSTSPFHGTGKRNRWNIVKGNEEYCKVQIFQKKVFRLRIIFLIW